MRPDVRKLEVMVRAEAESKLSAIGPLESAYEALLRSRDEFATKDADNVAAVQQARSEAIKAGLSVKVLDQLGFSVVEELIRESHARKRPRRRTKSVPLAEGDAETENSRDDEASSPAEHPREASAADNS